MLAIALAVGVAVGGPAAASGAMAGIGVTASVQDTATSGIGESVCVRTADGAPFSSGMPTVDCDPATPPPPPTPTPTPSPTPPPPATPVTGPTDPVIDTTGARGGVGAAGVGTTGYAAPAGSVYVATTGSDSNSGAVGSPYKSIQRAIDRAPSGATIVVRGGSYHEGVTLPREKKLTLQASSGEEVWLDGSTPVGSWQRSGSTWFTSGWTKDFDTSPTYKRGAADNTAAGWSFLSPAHPMAAHPDQVWFGTSAQRQVGSLREVTVGTFFVDRAADRIHVGSDPVGQPVRASAIVSAVRVLGPDSTVRGIGVRRYAPSVPDMGAVSVYGVRATLENLTVIDNSTTGISINAAGARVSLVTVARNGMLGMHANYADGLAVSELLSADNNREHFNRAPVSGGLKITRSRSVSVVESAFLRNDGNALWFDESVYDGRIVGNDLVDNSGNAVVVELSAKFTIADNVIARNGINGVFIEGSGSVDVWNNTIVENNRAVKVAQGDRRASNLATAGHDPRQSNPDPTVTWITEQISIGNNILSTATGNCIIGVEDYSHERSAQQMSVTANGNVYHRTQASRPAWAIVWSRGPGDPAVYTTIAQFASATGQEQQTLALDGTAAVQSGWIPSAPVRAAASKLSRPLPPSIVAATGRATAGGSVGAWLN